MKPLSESANAILHERYLRRDASGRTVEDPVQMFRRVARAIAAPAREFGEDENYWSERFFERMSRLEFLPNSPTLMNAGNPTGQLAACFVLPIEDQLESIFSTLGLVARIHQSGGGTGFSFTRLRPRGDRVKTTGGTSSGPLSFMDIYDYTTEVIRAGGRRRGANMAVLRVDHPDIEEFIAAKREPSRLRNFNLSVGVTDAFFEAFDRDDKFALLNPRNRKTARRVSARAIFDSIAEAAWESGDPGIVFLDQINRHNPTPALGAIEATNPCGEQPLLPFESCTLGSLNLAAFASADELDWERFAEAVRDAVVFLDNVVEANRYPAAEIADATRRTRKLGLGVMGLADLLAQLEIPYDSRHALELGGKIARFLSSTAWAASFELASTRGAFPAYAESRLRERGFPSARNAAVTCVAPTGTLSVIAGVAGGIEPFFALATARRALDGRRFVEINRAVEQELEALGSAGAPGVAAIREHGSLTEAAGIPAALARRFPIALEIPASAHLRMQAAFQEHVDAAVSKTVNLRATASPAAVREIFLMARELKLKGVTVYRYGSRAEQVLSLLEESARADCRECAV